MLGCWIPCRVQALWAKGKQRGAQCLVHRHNTLQQPLHNLWQRLHTTYENSLHHASCGHRWEPLHQPQQPLQHRCSTLGPICLCVSMRPPPLPLSTPPHASSWCALHIPPGVRVAQESDSVRAGLLGEQAALALLQTSPPSLRKFAFTMVLAGLKYLSFHQRPLAIRCYL